MILGKRLNPDFVLVGLGNPGKTYHRNRHNIGFMFVDHIATSLSASVDRKTANALVGEVQFQETSLVLAKPQTYMNETGRSVKKLLMKFNIPLEKLLVVFDDLDLPLGQIRIRPQGGSSGHKGMKSIFHFIHTQEFPRIRFGIGRPPGKMDPADYVLTDFTSGEMETVQESFRRVEACLSLFFAGQIEAAMTQCNTDKVS
jgi:PTH1 family peptidyl-tRNA hydrolase